MGNKKLKEKKAKAKERLTEKKKVNQRLFEARKKRSERELARLQRKYREKVEPIKGTNIEKLENNLTHNLEILKALEAEYVQNQQNRKNLNEELEAEGFKTIQEKLDAMKKKSIEMVTEIQAKADNDASDNEISEAIMPVKKNRNK